MNNWNFTDQNGKVTKLNLPHTWNHKDGQDGGNDYWRGTNKYDNVFDIPDFDKEKQCVYLQFHGVNASAKVILNEKTGKFRCETRLPYLKNTNFKHK